MKLHRFTVRRLMVIVAIVALAIAGHAMWGRRSLSLEKATYARNREISLRSIGLDIAGDSSMANSDTVYATLPDHNGTIEFRSVAGVRRVYYPRGAAQPADAETVERLSRWCLKVSAEYGEIRQKHEAAAHRPWLAIVPDPPEPK